MSLESVHARFAFRGERIHKTLALIQGSANLTAAGKQPEAKDVAAITWWLGGIYNEMEEVLKGIAEHFGDAVPQSSTWHRDLLDQMTTKTDRRAVVLSVPLRERLDALRAFRHFSRNATALDPDWERMQPLLAGLYETVRQFDDELGRFLAGD